MPRLTLTVRNTAGLPISGAWVSFAATGSPLGPLMQGGQTDASGSFVLQFVQSWPKLQQRSYILTVMREGYQTDTDTIALGVFDGSLEVVLADATLSGVTVSALPALVSVAKPPVITVSGLPTADPYAYLETTVTASGYSSVIETPITASGLASIVLAGKLDFEPVPGLVADDNTVLQDTNLRRDYTITVRHVSGSLSRLVGSYATTALLLIHASPAQLLGKWLGGDTLRVARGYYADATMLLPVGSYVINRKADNISSFAPLLVASDGKTPLRVRIPAVPSQYGTLAIYATLNGALASSILTVTFRES